MWIGPVAVNVVRLVAGVVMGVLIEDWGRLAIGLGIVGAVTVFFVWRFWSQVVFNPPWGILVLRLPRWSDLVPMDGACDGCRGRKRGGDEGDHGHHWPMPPYSLYHQRD
jgi:hypothetical protein